MSLVHQILPHWLLDNVEILSMVAQPSVQKTLCALKLSLISLLELMGVDGSEGEHIERQWKTITSVTRSKTHTTEAFWCQVNMYQDASGGNPFGALASFALGMLVMRHSNAEIEPVANNGA